MNETTRAAALSAIRTTLVAGGGVLVTRGHVTASGLDELIGAIMVLVPLLWGMWDKYLVEKKTNEREHEALNAGIAHANTTTTETPPVLPSDVKEIITTYAKESK